MNRPGFVSVVALSMIIAGNAFAQWQPPGATSGSIYYNGGNVGIGTPTPGEKLDVTGNVAVTGTLRLGKQLLGLPWTLTAGVWTTGYVKLVTPIVHNESNMFTIKIAGYSYPYSEALDIRCSGYAYNASTLVNAACSTTGFTMPVEITTETRPGGSAPVVVIRLGTPSTAWYYAHFTAEYNGWQTKSAADFQWVTGETTPAPGPNMNNVAESDLGGTLLIKAPNGDTAANRLTVEGGGTFSGRVGAGTASPLAPLHINGAASQSQLYVTNGNLNTGVLSALSNAADNVSLGFDLDFTSGAWKARAPSIASLYKSGGHFKLYGSGSNPVNGTPVFNVYQDVDLATGVSEFRSTTVPDTTRITGGTVQLTRVSGATGMAVDTSAGDIVLTPGSTNTRVNGNVIVTGNITGAKVIGAVYQDLAEWVPATSDMTPGTVVVLNRDRTNEVMPSSRSYDTSVAGVVSTAPGILLGIAGDSKEQIATTGRVKVRVDARTRPVRVGDLLVTSDLPGTAMRSEPMEIDGHRFHQPGTIVGKAIEPLESGVGEILVLLSLQ